jgi:site-specific recombinase XerD
MTTTTGTIALEDLIESFERHLKAERKATKTIEAYTDSARKLVAFLKDKGMPLDPPAITREHVEMFVVDELERKKASTVACYFRCLQQFFRWLAEEGEIPESPMRNMKAPRFEEEPVAVLLAEEVSAILDACRGTAYEDRRDMAIIRMFASTGLRLSELTGLKLEDVDLRNGTATCLGKGRKVRTVALGVKTIEALDRYLRARRGHPYAHRPELWLGRQGRMTPDGLSEAVKLRARRAGVKGVHPHRFRHTVAHNWLDKGGSEVGLMANNGWSSSAMVRRYAKSTQSTRAQAEARRLALDELF